MKKILLLILITFIFINTEAGSRARHHHGRCGGGPADGAPSAAGATPDPAPATPVQADSPLLPSVVLGFPVMLYAFWLTIKKK